MAIGKARLLAIGLMLMLRVPAWGQDPPPERPRREGDRPPAEGERPDRPRDGERPPRSSDGPAGMRGPEGRPQINAREVFQRYDRNGDYALDLREFETYLRESAVGMRPGERRPDGDRPPANRPDPNRPNSAPGGDRPRAPRLPEGARSELNLEYGPHGERNLLDLYLPANASGKPLPLLIWIHGGGWAAGSKEGGGPALQFLTQGYAVASINYRLSGTAAHPAQINDCKAAVRFLRANASKYGIDPDRFGCWGSSAGGHLVAMLGATGDVKDLEGDGRNLEISSRVQAVCDFYGPTDLANMGAQSASDSRLNHDAPDSPESRMLGKPIKENRDLADRASPMHYITSDDAPILIIHGDKDPVVPVAQSETYHKALLAAGVKSTLVVVPGAGHGQGIGTPENMEKIREFFDKYLKS